MDLFKQVTGVGKYNLREQEPIGKGTFGTVYKVYKCDNSEVDYAMKKITLKGLLPKDKHYCREEIKWMRELHHENIVELYDSFEIGDELYIVMEYCAGGSLRDYIDKSGSVPEKKCLDIMKQICAGLRFLHGKNIIHRDIKTGNIFLHNNVVKIGDLALARLFENPNVAGKITLKVGTVAYMSPEMVAGKSYGFETDIWGLGCCMYEMAMRQMPYPGKTETEVERKIKSENISFDGFPYKEQMLHLLQRMLHKEPSNRPKLDAVSDEIQAYIEKNSEEKAYKKTQGNITTLSTEVTNALGNSGAQKQRFMATFPGVRPKTTENLDILSEKKLAYDVSKTESKTSFGQQSKKITVYIPVSFSEDEYNMMDQADNVQRVLESKYLSSDELEKMFQLLENNMEESDFLDKMRSVIGNEKFEGAAPFLKSLWIFKAPLLKRTYKMVSKRTANSGD